MRSPVIERLMVRGSQVALKHVIHDMEARILGQNPPRQNPLGQNPPTKTPRGQNPPDKTPRTKPPGQNPPYKTPPDKTPPDKPPPPRQTNSNSISYVRSFFASCLYGKVTMSFYRPYHPIHFAL